MRVLWVFEHLAVQPQVQQVAYYLAKRADVDLHVMCPWSTTPPLDPAIIPLTKNSHRNKLDLASRRTIGRKLRSSSFTSPMPIPAGTWPTCWAHGARPGRNRSW